MKRRRVTGWQLAPFHLLESTIRPKLSIIDEEKDLTGRLMGLVPDEQSFVKADETLVRYLALVVFNRVIY